MIFGECRSVSRSSRPFSQHTGAEKLPVHPESSCRRLRHLEEMAENCSVIYRLERNEKIVASRRDGSRVGVGVISAPLKLQSWEESQQSKSLRHPDGGAGYSREAPLDCGNPLPLGESAGGAKVVRRLRVENSGACAHLPKKSGQTPEVSLRKTASTRTFRMNRKSSAFMLVAFTRSTCARWLCDQAAESRKVLTPLSARPGSGWTANQPCTRKNRP